MPPPHAGSPPADVCSGPGEGVPCSPLCHAPTHGGMQSPQTPQRFWVLCPSIWASCPAWGDNLTGSLSILVSLCRISPGFPSSPCKGQESAEGRALLPVLALGIQCSAMPLLPSHPALLSAFSCPPCCVLGPGFISGVEMGPGKSERSVWAAGPCLWCPFLAGAAQGAAQGLSRHSQQGSFFFGNTQQSPVHPTGSGLPVHRPHGAETQHWLCKSDTFIFFFKSPLPNCSILWRG